MYQTMTQTPPLSDPMPVLEWFKNQPIDAVVGKGGMFNNCPLVHYLRSLGYKTPSVTGYTYALDGALFYQEEWAQLFVYYVDTGFNNLPVTAHDAAYMVECALQELERRQSIQSLYYGHSPLEAVEKELVPMTAEAVKGTALEAVPA